MEKHTPAPWKLCSNEQDRNFQIIGANSLPVCVMHTVKSSSLANWGNKKTTAKTLWTTTANETEQANARRIIACVNACEGIPIDILESISKNTSLLGVKTYEDIEKQRDELLAALENLLKAADLFFADNEGLCGREQARAAIASAKGGEA